MHDFQSICNQFAQTVNGIANIKNGVCSVELERNFPSQYKTARLDYEGIALNLGEVVILQEELPSFLRVLVKNNLTVSAIHNHWVFTNPTVLYVHFQSVESPLSFARKFAEAFTVLKH